MLELLVQCDDSSPFREPVDVIDHPDYLDIIDNPMDLTTVENQLADNEYTNPEDFAKDVRLIFTNSKNYNTNKRSRVSQLRELVSKRIIWNYCNLSDLLDDTPSEHFIRDPHSSNFE